MFLHAAAKWGSERMNRTIMEKVRCLLSESGLDEGFWSEAAAFSVYTINRSPSSAVGFKIPEEIWLGKKPGYKHMRKFGSVVYVHTDQGKLKPRAVKGVLIGYPPGTKGYKIWLLDDEKCVVSRNVKFCEDVMFKDVSKSIKAGDTESSKQVEVDKAPVLIPVQETGESSTQGGATSVSADEGEVDNSSQVDVEQARDSLTNYQLARDRPRRTVVAPVKFNDYDCSEVAFALTVYELMSVDEPRDYAEAMASKDQRKWILTSDDEMDSLRKNGTWVLVRRPQDRKVISCKWLYKIKPGITEEEPERPKARLVARGFTQKEGIDYHEVFAPVVKHVSIRTLLSLVVNLDLELEQMDVKTAFLHGNLEEDLYMEQPEGYEDKSKPDHVCLLKKSLYGLKQSPRQWNKRFDEFMTVQGYRRSRSDACVYTKEISEDNLVYLLLYVDDMLLAAKEMRDVKKLKEQLESEFEMKDLVQLEGF